MTDLTEEEMRRSSGDFKREIEQVNREIEERAGLMERLLATADTESRDLTRREALEFDQAEATVQRSMARKRELDLLAESQRERRSISPDSEHNGGYLDDDVEQRTLGHFFAAEFRSLAGGSGSGSFIVPEQWADTIFDRLRAKSVGLRSGFRVVTTDTDTLHLPKLTGDAAASWVAEGGTITPTDPSLDEVVAHPKKLAALVIVSNELIADSNPSVMGVVSDNLIASLALKLDLAFYEGAGSATEPTGLKNVSGITLQSMGTNGALPTDFDPIADAIGQLVQDNATPTAIVMHPRSWARFVKLKTGISGDKTPLLSANLQDGVSPSIYGIPVFLSGQLSIAETQGSSSVASSIYVYEADQIVAVRRQETRVEVDPWRLFNSDQSEIRSISRWDVTVPNVKSVVRIAGVL